MPATIDAPPAPPSGVKIVPPSTAPKPPPAPTREIHVTPGSTAVDPGPKEPLKPGSAKERIFSEFRKKAGTVPESPRVQSKVSPESPTPSPNAPESPKPEGVSPSSPSGSSEENPLGEDIPEPGATQETTPPAPAAAEQPKPPGKEKVNPWRLVDQYKGQVSKLEKELADAKSSSIPEQQKNDYLTQIETLQKRNTQLEDEMRYVNYEQSTEFQEKYHQPYIRKFNDIMGRLSGVSIKDESGQARKVTPEDVLAVVSAPLDEAYNIAEQKFGRAADWVVQRGEELRSLWSERDAALTDAKTKGAERWKQQAEMSQKQTREVKDFVSKTWNSVNEGIKKDERWSVYFQPVEGDQEGNQSLAKGYAMVDRAFSENPEANGLTNEQRADIIRRHAAVRNRAAAAGRLIKWNQKLQTQIDELTAQLKSYKESSPPSGGGASSPSGAEAAPKGAWAGIQAALRAKAK